MTPLHEVAAHLGLHADDVHPWGPGMAKVDLAALERPARHEGRLALVTAITPTPAGEGKTTTSVGLAQGLRAIGRTAVAALRQPSQGPVFGRKGGGTGGGLSTLVPTARINLHLTGDLHAVAAAHNLLAALVDHHLHHRRTPELDLQRVTWRRVVDVNDRALREIVGCLGAGNGPVRSTGFDITAASELLAIHGLAHSHDDLAARIGRVVVGRTADMAPVTAADVGAVGAMHALMVDTLMPNLVQTTDGTPALVHGGPFANIAHGTSSVLASRLALRQAEWVVTEAGFAADLGAVKWAHIAAPEGDLKPAVVVIVATVRALRHHGAGDVTAGLANLAHHVDVIRAMGLPPVVAINRFPTDTADELAAVQAACAAWGVPCEEADPFGGGGPGCAALARLVDGYATAHTPARLDAPGAPLPERVDALVRAACGADGATWSARAARDARRIATEGADQLPLCLSKTPLSLTVDPARAGRPRGFTIPIEAVEHSAGAGFLVLHTDTPVRMPGLPKEPAAWRIAADGGVVRGVQ